MARAVTLSVTPLAPALAARIDGVDIRGPLSEEAWAAIASQQLPPDIVIADVRMPGLDGVALVQRIKARFAAVPVVLVSAFPDEPIWVQGLEAGALDVFPKPIHGASLVRALRKVVGAIQESRQLVGDNPDPRNAGINEGRSRT